MRRHTGPWCCGVALLVGGVAAGLFGKRESEFFTLTNAHPADSTFLFNAFDRPFGPGIGYGQYVKGALSASGAVTLRFESDQTLEVPVEVAAGSYYAMAIHSTEKQIVPKVSYFKFEDASFKEARSANKAVLIMANLVRMRDVQVFINGVQFAQLLAHEEEHDPNTQIVALDRAEFDMSAAYRNNKDAIIEVYDSSAPNVAPELVVRGKLHLESKSIYICHVMGDPDDQERFPYTLAMYRHSLSGAMPARPTASVVVLLLALTTLAIAA